MEKYLLPERSDSNTYSPTASKEWKYWLRALQSFLNSLDSNSNKTGAIEKLNLLKSLNSPAVYEYIDCTTYDEISANLMNYISSQAMKYSLVINW